MEGQIYNLPRQYKYYNPKRVLANGRKLCTGGAWAKFPKHMPNAGHGNILIGILAPGLGENVGAVEITNENDFDEFCNDYGRAWFCQGGTAFLYVLAEAIATECRDVCGVDRFEPGELERLTA